MKLVWWAWSDLRRKSNSDVDMSAQAKPLWPMALVVGFAMVVHKPVHPGGREPGFQMA